LCFGKAKWPPRLLARARAALERAYMNSEALGFGKAKWPPRLVGASPRGA